MTIASDLLQRHIQTLVDVFLREYFDPVRAARALDTPILGFES